MTRGVGGKSPSNIATHLKGIDFPCKNKDLVAHARKSGAEDAVMEVLEAMPAREYHTMAEVMEGFKEARGGGGEEDEEEEG